MLCFLLPELVGSLTVVLINNQEVVFLRTFRLSTYQSLKNVSQRPKTVTLPSFALHIQ